MNYFFRSKTPSVAVPPVADAPLTDYGAEYENDRGHLRTRFGYAICRMCRTSLSGQVFPPEAHSFTYYRGTCSSGCAAALRIVEAQGVAL